MYAANLIKYQDIGKFLIAKSFFLLLNTPPDYNLKVDNFPFTH